MLGNKLDVLSGRKVVAYPDVDATAFGGLAISTLPPPQSEEEAVLKENPYIFARRRMNLNYFTTLISSNFHSMIYGYIRVSTDRQTVANQRYEITTFCQKEHLVVDGWIQETISGTRATSKRQLGDLLNQVKKGDLIICAELSRLGRSLFMIMDILNTCMEKECRVWTIKEGYRLGEDIQSKVLAFAFGLSAEIERQLISQRTREALARRRAEGVVLGRKAGSKNQRYKLDDKADVIARMLKKGCSQRKIAATCGVSKSTLNRWMKGRIGLILTVD